MYGLVKDICDLAQKNNNFRQVILTAKYTQLVVMSIPPGEEIGAEIHEENDQILLCTEGEGLVLLNGESVDFRKNSLVLIPAGSKHNIINKGDSVMKIVTTYSPPHHPPGTIHSTKSESQ